MKKIPDSKPVRKAEIARIFTQRTETVQVRSRVWDNSGFITRETQTKVSRGKRIMKYRFNSPRSKNNGQIVEVLYEDSRGTLVRVFSSKLKFYCNGKNLKPITNKDLLC